MPKAKDLTGQRFGRLTVMGQNNDSYRSPSGKPTRRWDCVCDCGNRCTVLGNVLTSGHTKSCGCLQREKAADAAPDLTGQRFGRWVVLKRVPLGRTERNGARNGWLCRCDCGTERVVLARSLVNGESKSCGCATVEKARKRVENDNVLGRYSGTVVTAIQPGRAANKNSKSGIKGVYWSEREGKWIAKIGLRGKSITIGRFSHIDDAIKARSKAEDEYYSPIIEAYDSEKKGEET